MSLKKKIDRIYDICLNYREAVKTKNEMLLKEKNWKYLLQENIKLQNLYKGERCFILGNGPSLNDFEFSKLKDEYTFTVNQLSKRSDFNELKTNFHFWADPNFFELDERKPEDRDIIDVMRNVDSSDNHPICFYPINQYNFVKKHELDKNMETHYFLSKYVFYEDYSKKIDYSSITPYFGTVVQWCITMAIYMGFKEIYLLGCDTTQLINNINAVASEVDNSSYGYEVTENEKKRYSSFMKKYSLINSVEAYLATLKTYDRLEKYCKRNDIQLVNLSSKTAIDCIPRDSLENILYGKK